MKFNRKYILAGIKNRYKIVKKYIARKFEFGFFKQRFFIQVIRKPSFVKIERMYQGITSSAGLEKLIRDFKFDSVLDVGSGEGNHSEVFRRLGKTTTSIDFGLSPYFEKCLEKDACIVGDYNNYKLEKKYDCIWASHILEHQPNPHDFLKKVYNDLNDTGVLAITVPPMKSTIVGGHVNLYTPGLLLYQTIIAGFDCSDASLLWYDYNITLIVRKSKKVNISILTYDKDDVMILREYFPKEIQSNITKNFNGNISRINW